MDFKILYQKFTSGGKEPFDITLYELAKLIIHHFLVLTRSFKLKAFNLKRNSSITINIKLYYKIDGDYIGQEPLIKKDQYGVITYGEPFKYPVKLVVRHIILNKYNRMFSSIVVYFMLNSPQRLNKFQQNITVRLISSSFSVDI